MQIDRPIFILGPHRSGTTLLYGMLAKHPDLGYLARDNHRFPRYPFLAYLIMRLRRADYPVQGQKFWDYFWTGPDDRMSVEEATPAVISWYRKRVRRILRLRGVARFVAKYPRLSLRVEWLDRLFPGALFIHLTRDWRAVVNSKTLKKVIREKKEGGRWFGVRVPGWQEMRSLPHEIAAGRQYRAITLTLEQERDRYSDRFFVLHYEDLCAQPLQTIQRLVNWCGLDSPGPFMDSVPKSLQSANYKWREQLGKEIIEKIRSEDPAFYTLYERPE